MNVFLTQLTVQSPHSRTIMNSRPSRLAGTVGLFEDSIRFLGIDKLLSGPPERVCLPSVEPGFPKSEVDFEYNVASFDRMNKGFS